MARIFDNIKEELLTTLHASLEISKRTDFCIGYLNFCGWQFNDEGLIREVPTWQ